jgi:hypothetical protein
MSASRSNERAGDRGPVAAWHLHYLEQIELTGPLALLIPAADDEQHLMVLLPDGPSAIERSRIACVASSPSLFFCRVPTAQAQLTNREKSAIVHRCVGAQREGKRCRAICSSKFSKIATTQAQARTGNASALTVYPCC